MTLLKWSSVVIAAWIALSVPAGLLMGRWLRRAREAAENQAIALTHKEGPQ
jgi:hypothetical protein